LLSAAIFGSTFFLWQHWTPELRKLVAARRELPTFKSGNYETVGYIELKSILPTCD
jgi:hypothetical protein